VRIDAAVLHKYNESLEIAEIDLAPPKEGEVLVRIHAAGLCHSDMHTVTGSLPTRLPTVLGHEGAGVIEAVGGGVTHVAVGDHVVISWLPVCGHCENCLRGLPQQCTVSRDMMFEGGLTDGTTRMSRQGEPVYHYSMASTFATHMVVPAYSAIKVPASVTFEVAAIVGCAVTTGVGAVWNAARVRPGDRVAVFGCGGVGMSAIMGARAVGADPIIAVDINRDKVEKALACGASDGVLWEESEESVAEKVARAAGGGVDFAFDATGRVDVMEAAFTSTRAAGTTVCIGIAGPDEKLSIPARLIPRTERRIIGSFYGSFHPEKTFPMILDLHRRGLLPLERLVSHRMPLAQINEGFDLMRTGEAVRGVVEMPG
jgi:S-(hydroxymethyl)glutathione dehydrogenase / alcohol dehydrogenase